jgi:hypothetical protein
MDHALKRALKRIHAGGVVRWAESFYEILGNRRKFERLPIPGTISVTCKGSAVDNTFTCSCIDFSPRGIGIDSPEQMVVDTVIELSSDDHSAHHLACVRYCLQRSASYRVGLEFIADPQALT